MENVLNLVGFLVGLGIGIMSLIWIQEYRKSTLFRLTIAFFSIGTGIFRDMDRIHGRGFHHKVRRDRGWVQALGIGIQTVGYFFIALSHSIKSFMPKSRYFRSVIVFPLFLVSSVQIEHIFRSVSFILLAYGAIETILSYFENRNKGAISVATGLAMLALGEFLGWYSFVFPEPLLYYVSVSIKIGGLLSLFVPISRIP